MESTEAAYNIQVRNEELVLQKKATALVNFDDGVFIDIPG